MAIDRNGNTVYVSSTGATGCPDGTKVAYITFTPDASGDQLVLKDGDTSGVIKFSAKGATAKDTVLFDFSYSPLFFPNGIYVATLTASAVAVIVTTGNGAK